MLDYQVDDRETQIFIWFLKVLIWIGALAMVRVFILLHGPSQYTLGRFSERSIVSHPPLKALLRHQDAPGRVAVDAGMSEYPCDSPARLCECRAAPMTLRQTMGVTPRRSRRIRGGVEVERR